MQAFGEHRKEAEVELNFGRPSQFINGINGLLQLQKNLLELLQLQFEHLNLPHLSTLD